MQPALNQLVDYVKAANVFRRNKKDVEFKILAALLYFFDLSLRKTSKYLSLFKISHESVRVYYHRLKKVLKKPRKRERRLSIDETKIKLEKKR